MLRANIRKRIDWLWLSEKSVFPRVKKAHWVIPCQFISCNPQIYGWSTLWASLQFLSNIHFESYWRFKNSTLYTLWELLHIIYLYILWDIWRGLFNGQVVMSLICVWKQLTRGPHIGNFDRIAYIVLVDKPMWDSSIKFFTI